MKRRFVRWLFKLRLCDALWIAAGIAAFVWAVRATFYGFSHWMQ
jgi:hypothetical protein